MTYNTNEKSLMFSKQKIEIARGLYDVMHELSVRADSFDAINELYDLGTENLLNETFKLLANKYPEIYSNDNFDDKPVQFSMQIKDLKLVYKPTRKNFGSEAFITAAHSAFDMHISLPDKKEILIKKKILKPSKNKIQSYEASLLSAMDKAIQKQPDKKPHKWGIAIKVPKEHFILMKIAVEDLYLRRKIDLPSDYSYEYKYNDYHFYIIENSEVSSNLIVSFARLKDLQSIVNMYYQAFEKMTNGDAT